MNRFLALLFFAGAVAAAEPGDRLNHSLENGAELKATPCWFAATFGRQVECAWFHPSRQIKGFDVSLPVVIVHTSAADRRPSPILYLPGGPGSSAGLQGAMLVNWWHWFDAARWPHDMVLFDPRGTGLSRPQIDCPEIRSASHDGLNLDLSVEQEARNQQQAAVACYSRLKRQGLDPAFFATTIQVQDAGELMQLLGGNDWNLYGISYGTRLALQLLREYPERVRSLVLDSVYPPEVNGVLSMPAQFDRALDELIHGCMGNSTCKALHPPLRVQVDTVLKRLAKRPITLELPNWPDLTTTRLRVNDDRLIQMLFLDSYQPRFQPRAIPAIVGAYRGDYSSMLPMGADFVQQLLDEDFSDPVYYAVTCAEDFPGASRSAYDNQLQHHPQVSRYLSIEWKYHPCHVWPAATLPARFAEPVSSSIPVLILDGRYDAATLPEWGRAAVAHFPKGYYLAFEGSSHAVTWENHCAMAVAWEFLQDPSEWPLPPCMTPREVREAIRPLRAG